MKKTLILFFAALGIIIFSGTTAYSQGETVTISGRVTDFEGNPVDGSTVRLKHRDFTEAYEVATDEHGYYSMEVEKGRYMALYAMRLEQYPRYNLVPKEEMRLEFWAWNVIADRDLEINPRYERLELYGTTVFEVFGGWPGYMVYFRPMSLTQLLEYPEEVFTDKQEIDKQTNLSIKPENLIVKIYADDELLDINSIEHIEEYGGEISITGYIAHVSYPKKWDGRPYMIFRVEAENTEYGEKGENLYFYEVPQFK